MEKRASVFVAKERLEALVVSDRINCNPEDYALIKKDLFKTLSKYMELKENDFVVSFSRSHISIRLSGE